jgi:hypothetical protein
MGRENISRSSSSALVQGRARSKEKDLGGGELGDGLGSLRDGVLGQLSREDEPDGSLDLPRGDGRLLVVAGQVGGLDRDLVEDIVDERVHDGHGLRGDTGIGVDLLEHLVDVDLVRLCLGRRPLPGGPLLRHLLGGLLGRRLVSLDSHG